MCVWAHYFQGRKGKSGNDAVDKSEYYTPNSHWAFAGSVTCSLSSLRFYTHLWLTNVSSHCCKKESAFLQNESQTQYQLCCGGTGLTAVATPPSNNVCAPVRN